MSQESTESGLISTLKKTFSIDDLVVLLVSEGIGVPLTIAGGEAFAHEQMRPAIIGYGVGLPLMAFGFTFPFWKNWVADRARAWIVSTAYYGLPILLLFATIYVLGPYFIARIGGPDPREPIDAPIPSADAIAEALARRLPPPISVNELAKAVASLIVTTKGSADDIARLTAE